MALADPYNPELDEEDYIPPPTHQCHHCSRTFPSKWNHDKTILAIDLSPNDTETCDFYSDCRNSCLHYGERYLHVGMSEHYDDSLNISPFLVADPPHRIEFFTMVFHEMPLDPLSGKYCLAI